MRKILLAIVILMCVGSVLGAQGLLSKQAFGDMTEFAQTFKDKSFFMNVIVLSLVALAIGFFIPTAGQKSFLTRPIFYLFAVVTIFGIASSMKGHFILSNPSVKWLLFDLERNTINLKPLINIFILSVVFSVITKMFLAETNRPEKMIVIFIVMLMISVGIAQVIYKDPNTGGLINRNKDGGLLWVWEAGWVKTTGRIFLGDWNVEKGYGYYVIDGSGATKRAGVGVLRPIAKIPYSSGKFTSLLGFSTGDNKKDFVTFPLVIFFINFLAVSLIAPILMKKMPSKDDLAYNFIRIIICVVATTAAYDISQYLFLLYILIVYFMVTSVTGIRDQQIAFGRGGANESLGKGKIFFMGISATVIWALVDTFMGFVVVPIKAALKVDFIGLHPLLSVPLFEGGLLGRMGKIACFMVPVIYIMLRKANDKRNDISRNDDQNAQGFWSGKKDKIMAWWEKISPYLKKSKSPFVVGALGIWLWGFPFGIGAAIFLAAMLGVRGSVIPNETIRKIKKLDSNEENNETVEEVRKDLNTHKGSFAKLYNFIRRKVKGDGSA